MGKIIFSILMQFFSMRKSGSGLNSQGQLLNAVTTTLKREISGLILKISIGLVATGVLIYSLINLGQYFNGFLLKYQYGVLFSVLFFSLLSVGCIFLVFKLFYEKKKQVDPFEALFSKTSEKGFNFGKIYTTFLDGLNAGINESQNKTEKSARAEKTEKAEETKYEPPGMTH